MPAHTAHVLLITAKGDTGYGAGVREWSQMKQIGLAAIWFLSDVLWATAALLAVASVALSSLGAA